MNIDEKIAVMQAFRDGKPIQVFHKKGACPRWLDRGNESEPSWNWADYDYRIKQEPREFWLLDENDYAIGCETAEATRVRYCADNRKLVHVREVLP